MKERPSSQMSAPMPESSSSVASGGYMNQPDEGAASKKIEPQTKTPPIRKLQKPKAPRRGKGQLARTEHRRQEKDRHRLEDRHGEEEHHHRAVQREGLVVEIGRDQVVVGNSELRAHEQRQHAGEQHEGEGGRAVPEADLRVVDRGPVAPAGRIRPDGAKLRGLGGAVVWLAARRRHSSPFSQAAIARDVVVPASMPKAGIWTPGLMRSGSAMKRAQCPPRHWAGCRRRASRASRYATGRGRSCRAHRFRRRGGRRRSHGARKASRPGVASSPGDGARLSREPGLKVAGGPSAIAVNAISACEVPQYSAHGPRKVPGFGRCQRQAVGPARESCPSCRRAAESRRNG